MDSLSPRRSLYRTLSDESVCSNRKASSYASSHSSMLDQAMPNDILFSTTPPYHSTLPPRMIHNQAASNLRSEWPLRTNWTAVALCLGHGSEQVVAPARAQGYRCVTNQPEIWKSLIGWLVLSPITLDWIKTRFRRTVISRL